MPGRPRVCRTVGQTVPTSAFGIGLPLSLGREHRIETVRHAGRHDRRRDPGQQRGNSGEPIAEGGTAIAAGDVRADPAPAAAGDEPRAELGQEIGVRVGHLPPHPSPPCPGETVSLADRFPPGCAR